MKNLIYLFLLCLGLSACNNIKPLQISGYEQVKLNSLKLSGVDLELGLRLENPNFFAIKIKAGELHLSSKETPLTTVYLSKKIRIPAKSAKVHAIKFKTEWSSLSLATIPNLLELIKADEIEISTEGKVKAKVFLFSKTVNLKRTDMVKIKK